MPQSGSVNKENAYAARAADFADLNLRYLMKPASTLRAADIDTIKKTACAAGHFGVAIGTSQDGGGLLYLLGVSEIFGCSVFRKNMIVIFGTRARAEDVLNEVRMTLKKVQRIQSNATA